MPEEYDDTKIAELKERARMLREELEAEKKAVPLATVVSGRPNDATTRILRAWLAFIETLYQHGMNAEYTINNVELAHVFTLNIDTFRKLLNPLGMRNVGYSLQGRESFVNAAKALPEKLLLAHETSLQNGGRHYDVYAHVTPIDYPKTNTSRGYVTTNTIKEYSHGYNTTHDNAYRAEDET